MRTVSKRFRRVFLGVSTFCLLSHSRARGSRDGCHEPLSLWKDGDRLILIDGHNRKRICEKNDVPFTTKQIKLADRDHVKAWIGERQLGRRNLTDDQRAVVANDLREARSAIVQAEHLAKAREIKENPILAKSAQIEKPVHNTRTAVAKESKLPERKIRLAQEIKKVSPAVHSMVRAGTVSLTEGQKLSKLPDEARKTAIAAVNKGELVKSAVRAAKREDTKLFLSLKSVSR
jgi:hypothetical protein